MHENLAYALVALSNIAYFIVAAWLWNVKHDRYAIVLALVGLTSVIFHLFPHNHTAYYTDIVVACVSIAWLTVVYLRKGIHEPKYLGLSLLLFAIATYFFFDTGTDEDTDRTTFRYIYSHSLWHVLTALALYFLVYSVRNN